jgi:hypothetical protein
MDRGANIMKQLIIDRIEANEFCRDFPKLKAEILSEIKKPMKGSIALYWEILK